MLTTHHGWILLGLVALPLVVLAWATTWRVLIEAERNRHERYLRFYSIMEQLSRTDSEGVPKVVAAHQLRQYPEYADIVAKIFTNGRIRQDTPTALQAQLNETLKQLEERSPN